MSVQAGIWNFDGRPVDHKLLADMTESLEQQGPDGESSHLDGSVALLYRPFHTTAESRREKQPQRSRRGFLLTCDGRIDNRDELIGEMGGDVETNPTDIALLAAAFDRSETKCFRRIVGDWALSIWKPQQRELILASDYMAIRHIFYSLKKDRVWWSTNLTALVLLSGDKFHINDDYIAGYFANDPDAHLTPYREIHEVPPGHFVSIRNGSASVQRYWWFSPKARIRYKSDTEYEEHFRYVFRNAVRRRLRSDSPVLAELSGGLDSSSIVCMADDIYSKEGAQMPRLDTISYYDKAEPNGDDWIFFQKIEEKRGKVGAHIDVSTVGSSPVSQECSEFNPLPGNLDSGHKLEAERAAVVRNGGYRVVLSGIGGDEFMGGIPNPAPYLADLVVQGRLITLARQLLAWSLVKRKPWINLLAHATVDLLPNSLAQYLIRQAKVVPWIERDFARRKRLAIRQLDVEEHFGLCLPTRRSYIAGVLLMANKLAKWTPPVLALEENRYPYVDQNLIEFILSIPASQLLRPGQRRSLMRRALAGIVPYEILSRGTKQFGARTPVVALERNWKEIRTALDSSLLSCLGYIDGRRFMEELQSARNGKEIHIVRALKTISLEFWLRDLAVRGLVKFEAASS